MNIELWGRGRPPPDRVCGILRQFHYSFVTDSEYWRNIAQGSLPGRVVSPGTEYVENVTHLAARDCQERQIVAISGLGSAFISFFSTFKALGSSVEQKGRVRFAKSRPTKT